MVTVENTKYHGIYVVREIMDGKIYYNLAADNGDEMDLDHYPTESEIDDFRLDVCEQYGF